MRRNLVSAAIVSLLLTACVIPRDSRTQAEKDREAEIWTHALSLQVVIARSQVTECNRLGVVSERYFEDVPSDPMKRLEGMAWPEYMLRFKTAQLGGNAALAHPVEGAGRSVALSPTGLDDCDRYQATPP